MRVSSEDQAREGTSLDAQLAECRRYALRHGWPIDSEFTDVMSGSRDDRPQYQVLLKRVRELRALRIPVVVIVAALDRFGRRMLERVRCREELKALDVATHSVREGGEVSDLVANVLASVAQEEVARLGMRIRHTWAHLAEQGWRKVGGRGVAWGYRPRPATETERRAGSPRTVVEPDPAAAPYVREMFERIARGDTTRNVTRWATGLPSDVRGGRALTRRTVQDVLAAPLYAGLVTQDGPRGQWQPIVDEATFRRVQERIGHHQQMPRQASGRYLLTGLLRCPVCGSRMRGESMKARRYRCGGGDNSGRCPQTADAARVEQIVLTQAGALIDAISDNARVQAALRQAWQQRQESGGSGRGQQTRQLEATIERSRKRIARATELLVDGTIEKPAYDDLIRKARDDAAAAERELEDQRGAEATGHALPPLESVLSAAGSWSVILGDTDLQAQRDVLSALLLAVVPTRECRGVYRVTMTWTPLGRMLSDIALTPSP